MSTLKVLSLDGGGMRGTYTASYLDELVNAFEKRRKTTRLDFGKAFQLIVGTSTGAIVACALANDVSLSTVRDLYKQNGKNIFPRPIPDGDSKFAILQDIRKRPESLQAGTEAFRKALEAVFGDTTVADVYNNREIALAIPAVEMEHHQSFVFKTAHLPGSMHRDDDFKLVDVCLASTAAPIYRSLAAVDIPRDQRQYRVFSDGGLWANNPVLVGLIDALQMTKDGDRIEIFCMGTCPRPAGEIVRRDEIHRGLKEWKFGSSVATLGIDVQQFAYDNIVRLLKPYFARDLHIMRFPAEQVSAPLMPYLDLDNTSDEAQHALTAQARRDAEITYSRCDKDMDYEGSLVAKLFMEMPVSQEGK